MEKWNVELKVQVGSSESITELEKKDLFKELVNTSTAEELREIIFNSVV
jgi:hypothetical protein